MSDKKTDVGGFITSSDSTEKGFRRDSSTSPRRDHALTDSGTSNVITGDETLQRWVDKAREINKDIGQTKEKKREEITELLRYISDKEGQDVVLHAYNKALDFMQNSHLFDQKTDEEIKTKIQERYTLEYLDDKNDFYIVLLRVKGASQDSYSYAVEANQNLLYRDYHYRNRPPGNTDANPYDSDTAYKSTKPAHLSEIDRFILCDIAEKRGSPVKIQQCVSRGVTNSNLVKVAQYLHQALKSGYPGGQLTNFQEENDSLLLKESGALTALLGAQLNRSTILLAKRSGMKITKGELKLIKETYVKEQHLILEPEGEEA